MVIFKIIQHVESGLIRWGKSLPAALFHATIRDVWIPVIRLLGHCPGY